MTLNIISYITVLGNPNLVIALVANKSDLDSKREVQNEVTFSGIKCISLVFGCIC